MVCSAKGGLCRQHSDVVARAQPREVPEEREEVENLCRVLCEEMVLSVTVELVRPNGMPGISVTLQPWHRWGDMLWLQASTCRT